MRNAWLALSILTLTAGGCGVSRATYNSRLEELARVKADLDAQRQRADQLEKQLAAERGQENTLRGEEEAAEKQAAQLRDLAARFQAMVDAGKLKVEIRDGLMIVKLAEHILFDPGKTDLKKEGQDALKEVARILVGLRDRKFQVAGHTDNQPLGHGARFRDNWELSTGRATEVVRFLIKDAGMPANRVSAAGFADQLPVGSNDTEEGRHQNRRIEVVLLPNLSELAVGTKKAGK